MNTALKQEIIDQMAKARAHLDYSYNKVLKIPLTDDLDDEQLETLESFSSRFARYSDIIVSKYFRYLIKEKDPAFRGSIIDLFNQAEKFKWIESADVWRRIRELRNVAAHEYEASDYKKLYAELINLVPHLFKVSFDL